MYKYIENLQFDEILSDYNRLVQDSGQLMPWLRIVENILTKKNTDLIFVLLQNKHLCMLQVHGSGGKVSWW